MKSYEFRMNFNQAVRVSAQSSSSPFGYGFSKNTPKSCDPDQVLASFDDALNYVAANRVTDVVHWGEPDLINLGLVSGFDSQEAWDGYCDSLMNINVSDRKLAAKKRISAKSIIPQVMMRAIRLRWDDAAAKALEWTLQYKPDAVDAIELVKKIMCWMYGHDFNDLTSGMPTMSKTWDLLWPHAQKKLSEADDAQWMKFLSDLRTRGEALAKNYGPEPINPIYLRRARDVLEVLIDVYGDTVHHINLPQFQINPDLDQRLKEIASNSIFSNSISTNPYKTIISQMGRAAETAASATLLSSNSLAGLPEDYRKQIPDADQAMKNIQRGFVLSGAVISVGGTALYHGNATIWDLFGKAGWVDAWIKMMDRPGYNAVFDDDAPYFGFYCKKAMDLARQLRTAGVQNRAIWEAVEGDLDLELSSSDPAEQTPSAGRRRM